MSTTPVVDRIRIIPKADDFLDRNVGRSSEIYFNAATDSLRVYTGQDRSGFEIARADLSNISDTVLEDRINELGISGSNSESINLVSSSSRSAYCLKCCLNVIDYLL